MSKHTDRNEQNSTEQLDRSLGWQGPAESSEFVMQDAPVIRADKVMTDSFSAKANLSRNKISRSMLSGHGLESLRCTSPRRPTSPPPPLFHSLWRVRRRPPLIPRPPSSWPLRVHAPPLFTIHARPALGEARSIEHGAQHLGEV